MTEEQRERNRQYNKEYRLKNPDYFKAYRAENKKPPKIPERVKRFATTGISQCNSGHAYTGRYCKPCRAAYYEKNSEHTAAFLVKYYEINREKILQKAREYRANNKEKLAVSDLANARRRQADKAKRTPPWYNHAEAKAYYADAKKVGLVVDHIIPLRGKRVSGLHWAHNLQLLTFEENAAKSNKFDSDTYVHELPATIPQ